MIVKYAELLTLEWVERVHEASIEILEEVGLLVHNPKARNHFARHGCQVDQKTQIVKLPRQVVEYFCQAIPPQFTFHGRDPQFDRTIPRDSPLFATSGSSPDICDPDTGEVRRAYSVDIARIAQLVSELPGYDLLSIPVIANDAPPGRYHLSRYYPALKNTLKPVLGSAPGSDEAVEIFRLGVLVAGNEKNYRDRPFMTYGVCPIISPLVMDNDSTEMLIFFAEQRLPFYCVLAPNAGMTAPMTLLGTLSQCNAEFLALAVLSQMSRSGTPLIYAALPTVADMRTGAYAPGGIETGLLMMGCAQMARFYNVPCSGYVGLTNAKVNDAQSGYETGMSAMAAMSAGVDLLHTGGLLDALTTFDFAKAVIDNEIALMLKRVMHGFEFCSENFALDVLRQVGPGGTFINKSHTRERVRTAAFLPEISDRDTRVRWQDKGSLDTNSRAINKAHEILSRDNPAVFSPEVDALIRAEFDNLVTGDT